MSSVGFLGWMRKNNRSKYNYSDEEKRIVMEIVKHGGDGRYKKVISSKSGYLINVKNMYYTCCINTLF